MSLPVDGSMWLRAMHIMLDCGRVNALRLRFQDPDAADVVLNPGVHAIGRDESGRAGLAPRQHAVAQFCVDRRGVWLQVREGARGVHVNGRPVRRVAMLRAGDAVFADGIELTLLADAPEPAPSFDSPPSEGDPRIVLRGVGGRHHGRCFTLDTPRLIGRSRECDVRIDEPSVADRHARLTPHVSGVVLHDAGSRDGCLVNGHAVRNALLRPGDQLVIDGRNRFIIESPSQVVRGAPTPVADVQPDVAEPTAGDEPSPKRLPSSVRRLPWLLLAAVMIAGALSLLLLYGAR